MGKRYYCDYCDRSFIDDIESRKKHINSNNHIRNRKLHYAACRDLTTLVEEESTKDDCKRFQKQGYCPFEESCNFTHYSKEELRRFSAEVKNAQKARVIEHKLPSTDDWLQKHQKQGNMCQTLKTDQADFFQGYSPSMLPPSLRPLTIDNIRNAYFESWG